MTHFDKPTYTVRKTRKKEIPQGVYTKDPVSGEAVFTKDIADNQMVVPASGHHFPIGARERLGYLLDPGSFVESNIEVRSADPLQFVDSAPYPARIKKYEKESGLPEAVVTGAGKIHGVPVSLAVMDFRFCGGTLGSAAGEKITRAIETAIAQKIPCIIFSTSGGARMQEGILSLMQMAKTSAALGRLAAARLPYISVLTHPTTGGVSASYATLGDVILAEPGALIGFAGPRVIKDTTKQTLPPGFQTSEFLLKHGLIDQIVPRTEMRERLHQILLALYVKQTPASASVAKS
ncbi:acetyl-CoA carboxylase, carboxyltransferase subunit beta [Opitutus terrae]|uniref:Acetyl-coenzyme A carboxylase carboxyl transferase subunit beta n=1 Tax=Opitutus terrae (strain DSM 11246 / JCM 15787 / PB90-1) TaxID=452637 RepID=ACCD_OPITP|nr:acetyl-CoA carboxylase, carboxyltransferase subunit beta [Opitutus terrae]B1ZVD6.1 RecName: Full=Acetyl-coenzyme A carboxylase carboxyl transferase subunit beta; Short=ACCase subunit beta; Short=Acetyl-CoA carboxylase carboxyltransferase subunit beta [Opitutus terrae PB90-1]ACB76803.1 acetyl-CoA carboxylase, carboxyl transferase, beta subunit [Opitutus terrae PB90-1]